MDAVEFFEAIEEALHHLHGHPEPGRHHLGGHGPANPTKAAAHLATIKAKLIADHPEVAAHVEAKPVDPTSATPTAGAPSTSSAPSGAPAAPAPAGATPGPSS